MRGTKTILKNLPDSPGVYKMKDKDGRIIYIGKAKNLRSRVSQYFQKNYVHSTRTSKLLEHTSDIEYIQTDTELEALLLENNLIKELRPKYNILMKDDKSYVYIKVDLKEEIPKISLIRQHTLEKQGREKHAKYFGPKLASHKVFEMLRIVKKLFPYQHWEGMNYYLKDVPDTLTLEERATITRNVLDFLSGKTKSVEEHLELEMKKAAENRLFEKAARIRDKLASLRSLSERQKIIAPEREDTDVINFAIEHGRVYFNIFMIREWKLIAQENFMLDALEMKKTDLPFDIHELIESFLTQYYEKATDIPIEILIPEGLSTLGTLEEWLTRQRGSRVHILHPKRGEKNKLLELSLKNAIFYAQQHRITWMAEQAQGTALSRLAEMLKISEQSEQSKQSKQSEQGGQKRKHLKRIEGYDISHLGGNETVGGMVVFENGIPKPEHYRQFKMRTVKGKPDDYRSMEEVLTRRLKYLTKQEKNSTRKARKKESSLIQSWGTALNWKELTKNPDWRNFYLLMEKKKSIGMARLIEIKQGIFMIEALYIIPEYRGGLLSYTFMQKLIGRIKNKKARLYISVEDHFLNHWLNFGFIEVHNVPKEVMKRNVFFEKLDNTKYTVLAYYPNQKKKADVSFSSRPNLIVVDGGKGQLSAALLALKKLELEIPVIALAKRLEEIYIPGKKVALRLPEGDEALKLLQRIRDESHRFAITFQRELHRKHLLQNS